MRQTIPTSQRTSTCGCRTACSRGIMLLLSFFVMSVPSSGAVPVTLTVKSGPRQTFQGLGASIFPWTPSSLYNSDVTPAQTRTLMRLLWHDARLRSVRLWIHPGEEPVDYYVDGFVGTHKLPDAIAAGAKDLILAPDHVPGSLGDGHGLIRDDAIPTYTALLAQFILDFKAKTGILINHVGVLNEPNDRPVKFSNAQWPTVIKSLRSALNTRGLQAVGIVAPESANCGDDAYAVVDAIRRDPDAWNALEAVATHSYNNAATLAMMNRTLDKPYWITEAGGIMDRDEDAGNMLEAASISSRFLNDVNHGVTNWQFFIGAEREDPNGNTGRMLKYGVSPFHLTVLQRYYSLKQLAQTFDVGAVFRTIVRSDGGEMTYTYCGPGVHKPPLNAAMARNPDGTWGIGLSNFTSDDFTSMRLPEWYRMQGGGPAQTFDITIAVPELTHVKSVRFVAFRNHRNGEAERAETVIMHYGRMTVRNVGPFDLVTLRSEPTKQH